jgi:uncharacterized membrane protein
VFTGPRLTWAALALALFGAGITAYLTVEHGRGGSPACIIGHGCTVIASSEYAHIGDLPTASLGLLTYLVIAVLAGMRLFLGPPPEVAVRLRQAALALTVIGTAFSAFLMYIALFDLKATCPWCIGSAVTMTPLLIVTVVEMRAERGASAGPGPDED